MEKYYKLSKFNLHCLDSEGNLLLCNFLTGVNSLSVVRKDQVKEFEKAILKKANIIADIKNESTINQLYKIGFLVDIDADEDALYDAKFYETVYSGTWQLIIMPTHQCNFKCKYCYESSAFRGKGEMSLKSQNNILKYIQKNAVFYSKLRVAWFGGEPLLATDTVEYLSEGILKVCNTRKILYEAEMTTNAYNMTPEVFDMLYRNKIYIYQITLDGAKAEHDKQRVKADGSGTFDRIFDNLMYIRNNKQKYRLAKITIRTNVTRDIMLNLDEFLDLYQTHFASDERFTLRFTEANQYEQDIDEQDDSRLLKSDYLERKEFLDIIYSDEYRERMTSIGDIVNMFTPTRYLCYAAARDGYVIDAELNVFKCTVHFDLDENKIGYINDNGDMVIDETLNKKWYVRKSLPDECKSCFYLPCCNKTGCPLKYNASTDTLYKKCHMEKLNEKMSINMRRLAKHISFKAIEMEI